MNEFITYTVLGVVLAAGYAVISSGLVLTYATTGVFNFAQGATGMLAAFVYWQLHVSWGWSTPLALVVTLGILAPLLGLAIDLVMRGLDNTSETTKLVVTVSFLIMMIGIANRVWPPTQSHVLPQFWAGRTVSAIPGTPSYHDMITIGVALLVAIGLRLLLYRTRIGVAMRAAVDDRSLTSLNGIRTVRVNQLSWVLGTALAAVGGLLVAPRAGLDAVLLSTLIVNAYAAAIFGRLRSLWLTFVGALVLGLTDAYLQGYLPQNKYLSGLRLASPMIVLFIVLLVMPNSRLRTHGRVREYFPAPSRQGLMTFAGISLVGGLMLATTLAPVDLTTYAKVFSIGIIALSLVPLVGFANQVSLCQLSLAGVGAVMMAHFGHNGNPIGVVLAIVVAAIVGALVALPALRLSGIYLALATAAFAVALDRWIFGLPNFKLGPWTVKIFEGGSTSVDALRIGGIRFDTPKAQFVLVVVAFALCAAFVGELRRSRFGRRLIALRDSEAACATFGMSLIGTRVTVFAVSAGLAGLGGALYGMQLTSIQPGYFDFTTGLPLFMMVAVGGAGFISAGLFAAVFLQGFFPLSSVFAHWFTPYQPITTGFVGVGLGQEPSGAAPQFREGFQAIVDDHAVQWSTLAALVVVWLFRLVHAYGNWLFVILLIAVFAAGAFIAQLRATRKHANAKRKPPPTPLEWVGVDGAWPAERLAEVDEALALQEFAAPVEEMR